MKWKKFVIAWVCIMGLMGHHPAFAQSRKLAKQIKNFRKAVKTKDKDKIKQAWIRLNKNEEAEAYLKENAKDTHRLFRSYGFLFKINESLGRENNAESAVERGDRSRHPPKLQIKKKRKNKASTRPRRSNQEAVARYPNQDRFKRDRVSNRTRALRSPNQSRRPNKVRSNRR